MTHLTRYEGPAAVVERHGRIWLYDSGSGELIAEFAPDAIAQLREHPDLAVDLKYDGHGHVDLKRRNQRT